MKFHNTDNTIELCEFRIWRLERIWLRVRNYLLNIALKMLILIFQVIMFFFIFKG